MLEEFSFVLMACLSGCAVSGCLVKAGIVRTAVLTPVIGILMYLMVSLPLLAFGVHGKALAYAFCLAIAGGAVFSLSPMERRRLILRLSTILSGLGLSLLVLAGLVFLSHEFPAARATKDSFGYLLSAAVIAEDGSVELARSIDVLKRLAVIPLMHVTGSVESLGYSVSVTPLFGVLTMAVLGWGIRQEHRVHRLDARVSTVLIIVSLAYLLSVNRFGYMFFYINGHMMFAFFLLVAVVFGSAAGREHDRRLLLVSALAYAMLPWLRVEGVLVGSIFVAIHAASSALGTRDRLIVALPFAISGLVWWGVVIPGRSSSFVLSLADPAFGNLVVLGALIMFVLACGASCWVRRWSTMAVLAAMVGALLVLLLAGRGDIIGFSASVLWKNMNRSSDWGYFWYVIPVMVLLCTVSTRVTDEKRYIYGIAAYMILLLILPVLRDNPYRIGSSDSGNRMLIHVIPLMMLYVLGTAGAMLGRKEAPAVDGLTEPGRDSSSGVIRAVRAQG